MTLNVSAVLLTMSIVGLLVAMRVVLAILLAIAPAMAGFILFNGTRGMAQAWLGAIAAAALAPLFVLLVAAIEFAILAPMIARLLREQSAGTFENTSVMPIGLVTIVFTVATIIAVRAGARIGRGITIERTRSAAASPDTVVAQDRVEVRERQLLLAGQTSAPAASRALESIARRDAPTTASARLRSVGSPRASSAVRDARADAPQAASNSIIDVVPTRRSSSRAATPMRRSRAASRRDG
jgi:type IV secretion system protein VirB6